ncbi:MAG: pilin, partial [Patescibacteria group bacterium]|nr:pilin [Patescibacteria group bacterium]
MKKRLKLLASFLITISFLIPVSFVSAGTPIEAGLDKVDENIILSNTNPIVMAVRIINIFLMFLGIIAVSLVIYGGFVWMTSNGNEDKIKTAKKILKNALIGLIIILSSWGIAAFILRQLTGSGSPSGINSSSKQSQNYQIGLGAVGACVVENFYPNAEKSNVPRNSSIMITFKEEILSESICRNAS